MKDKVTFTINRKRRLGGGLSAWRIYVNGEFVGNLASGQTLTTQIPRNDAYVLSTVNYLEESREIRDESANHISVEAIKTSGFGKSSRVEFMRKSERGGLEKLPNPLERVKNYHADIDEASLAPKERTLRLCAEFWEEYADGLDEVLYNEKWNDMLRALKEIGADQVLHTVNGAVTKHLAGIALPLSEDIDAETEARVALAAKTARALAANEARFDENFREAMLRFLSNTALKDR